jgi:prenyltransferase beta subunit
MAFATLVVLVCFSIIPVAFAKTRQSHIIDFIYERQTNYETFGATPQDTAYALEVINYYDSYVVQDFLGVKYRVDKTLLKENLTGQIEDMFNNEQINIYDLYYLLKSLDILEPLEESLDINLHNKIYNYINETYQEGGGFGPTNTSKFSNMISTYFIYNIYIIINEPILNKTHHQNWILSCNNTDGGYGGNQTLSSTLLTTVYAVYLLESLEASLINQTKTLEYLNSLYVADPSNLENYGGYLPDLLAQRALLRSTDLCIRAIKLIDINYLNSAKSIEWVLGLQNFEDGGFAENLGTYTEKKSSITATYSAFRVIYSFDSLNLLNEDIFMVEFNFLVLIIVLSSIIGVVALIYIIWRKRRI